MCNVFNPLLEDVKRGSGFENGKKKIVLRGEKAEIEN